jgi:hypothetical protein
MLAYCWRPNSVLPFYFVAAMLVPCTVYVCAIHKTPERGMAYDCQ